MSAFEGICSLEMLDLDSPSHPDEASASEPEFDDPAAKITYGGFIFMLQKLGIQLYSLPTFQFGTLVGKGTYFSVYQVKVRPTNYESLSLVISKPETPLFDRSFIPMNTYVAFKRMKVRDDASGLEVSDPGQLYAICREVQALTHPRLREHENIVKLQAIVWENGFGTGNESDLPMWPTLVLEYCETTLADYQSNNSPLPKATKIRLCSRIGAGMDALHLADVFHGDLKSENVLLKIGKQGEIEPKLADFGCSVILERTDARKGYWIGGTEMWCAPECPGYFTTVEDIVLTDFYSFGLLGWRIDLDGVNPFEKLGIISSELSEDAKLKAVRVVKESDLVSPLYRDGFDKDVPEFVKDSTAGFLKKDPLERLKAIEETARITSELIAAAIQGENDNPKPDTQSVMRVLDGIQRQLKEIKEDADLSQLEEEQDQFELLSFRSLFSRRSFVPDCAQLSKRSAKLALNAATRHRIFEELMSILDDETPYAYPQKCAGCLELTLIDTEPHTLTPETLLEELQRYISNDTGEKHTCPAMSYASNTSDHYASLHGIHGASLNPDHTRKGIAVYQLYLANCAGFGTEQNADQALKVLENGMNSGYPGYSVLFCLLSSYLNRVLPLGVPFRKWLTQFVLFQSGIPSEPFRALRDLDPSLAETVAAARSRVYNGSTASFENMKFNAIRYENGHVIDVPPHFLQCQQGSPAVQEEYFENTLLHLVAGSDTLDVSMLEYCISTLGIDKDVRNADGATPLLLACRAARKEKIMALLHLKANVDLSYVGGETPLHWLGLLPDPAPVLEEFIRRGANIDAQITQLRALPNFQDFYRGFYMYGSPLIWAMTLRNARYVEALIDQGANIHLKSSIGSTPISFACRPGTSQYLTILARASTFQISRGDISTILTNWSTIETFRTLEAHQSQEYALELLLSTPLPIHDVESLLDFYRFIVMKAVNDSPSAILKILLDSLRRSTQGIQKADPKLDIDADSPLSHPGWADSLVTHNAAARGDVEILTLVLSYGGDAAGKDAYGRSTLHYLSLSSNNGNCVEVLANHGALSTLDYRTSPEGMTAFALALASCNFAVADRLLEYTPEAERQKIMSSHPASEFYFPELSFFGHFVAWSGIMGEKPLQYLCNLPEVRTDPERLFIVDEGHQATAVMMACGLRSDADLYDTDWFAKSRRRRAMRFLLRTFPEKRHRDARDCFGNTALHVAAFHGIFDMAEALLEARCDINPVTNWGSTPLDMVFSIYPPFVHELLKEPAGKTIIQIYERGRNDICQNLRDLGAIHKSPLAEVHKWADHLPFPWVREMIVLHGSMVFKGSDVD